MTPTQQAALERLAQRTTPIWLVQRHPASTDIRLLPRTAPPDHWCVKRHAKEIRRGDRVVLWLSGADAGVYALGDVTAAVRFPAPLAAGGEEPSPELTASMDLFLNLFDRPVMRTVLRADPRFADESILRQPFAANPHRLSAAAFRAVLERVRAPT